MNTWPPVLSVRLAGNNGAHESFSLHPGAGATRGFRERLEATFDLPDGAGWSLRIDDEEMPAAAGPTGRAGTWTPGFFAGEVEAELLRNGSPVASYRLDVSPDGLKVGADAFRQMVDELWQEDPTLVIGTEPAQTPIGSLGGLENPLLEYARLKRYGPLFLAAMRRVAEQPIRAVVQERVTRPLHEARRVDLQTFLSLRSTPAAAAAVAGVSVVDTEPPRLDLPSSRTTLDNAANRTLACIARSLLRRSRALLASLRDAAQNESESGTRTTLASRWPVRRALLEEMEAQLVKLLRRSPLRDVTRAEISPGGLTAIAAHPLYGRAYRLGWRALRHGIDGEHEERMWISPTWEIYERWCYVRLVASLGEVLGCPLEPCAKPPASSLRACSAAFNDSRIMLLLQPVFPAQDKTKGDRFSVSGRRLPDIVLTVEHEADFRFCVFDAKYSRTRPNVLAAMTSAHVYHDALRWAGARPEFAVLLVPAGGGVPALESARVRETEGVGVLPTADGLDSTRLTEVLSSMLQP